MSEPMPYAWDSSALAFALTRTKLSLPYSVEVACDLEQFSLPARREARCERWGLAGDQDNVDSKNPKMCQFQATTSMQSAIHQAQGEG
ncbi:hypothetical protein EMCRGX_G028106 [Ephydatia muelleri]